MRFRPYGFVGGFQRMSYSCVCVKRGDEIVVFLSGQSDVDGCV